MALTLGISDTVQIAIITMVSGLITTLGLIVLAWINVRGQNKATAQAEKADQDRKEVKEELAANTGITASVLQGIAEVGGQTLTHVNAARGAQLRQNAENARWRADRDPSDRAATTAAIEAEKALSDHEAGQRAVDAKVKDQSP